MEYFLKLTCSNAFSEIQNKMLFNILNKFDVIQNNQERADMNNEFDLDSGDSLKIKNSSTRYKLIHPSDYDYFDACRSKLYWGLPIVK